MINVWSVNDNKGNNDDDDVRKDDGFVDSMQLGVKWCLISENFYNHSKTIILIDEASIVNIHARLWRCLGTLETYAIIIIESLLAIRWQVFSLELLHIFLQRK